MAYFQPHLEFAVDSDISYASHCHLRGHIFNLQGRSHMSGLQRRCFWSCLPIFQIVVIISTYKVLSALFLHFDPGVHLITIARTDRCQRCSTVSVTGLLSVKRVFSGTLKGCATSPCPLPVTVGVLVGCISTVLSHLTPHLCFLLGGGNHQFRGALPC